MILSPPQIACNVAVEGTVLRLKMFPKITHETIAGHMGTAREVVTRMLRYFQSEGMVKLARGTVEITDGVALEELQHA